MSGRGLQRRILVGNRIFQRVKLFGTRTPIHKLPNLTKIIGINCLWVKRDDLISFGFGGNKVRGLEYFLGDALAKGADTLITGAGPLSNHVRATAAAAATCGLKMVAVYWGDGANEYSGNYKLVRMLGAQTRFTGTAERTSVDIEMDVVATELRRNGSVPYVIPRGGASMLGVVGQFMAVRETMKQFAAHSIMPDVIVVPVGSGGTMAGWLLGTEWFKAPWRVEGVAVSRTASESKKEVIRLIRSTESMLEISSNINEESIVLHDGYLGAGYGIPSELANAAISLTAHEEGMFLDPIYTGKTMAGIIDRSRKHLIKPNEVVLFLHSGGQPGLFEQSQLKLI